MSSQVKAGIEVRVRGTGLQSPPTRPDGAATETGRARHPPDGGAGPERTAV